MFTSLKNMLPRALEKNKIDTEIQKIERKERVGSVLQEMFGDGVEVIRCQKDMIVRVRHHAIANEIKLRDRQIKGRLKEIGITIETIKCA